MFAQIRSFLKKTAFAKNVLESSECKQAYYKEKQQKHFTYNVIISIFIALTIVKYIVYFQNLQKEAIWLEYTEAERQALRRNYFLILSQHAIAIILFTAYTVVCSVFKRMVFLQQYQGVIVVFCAGIIPFPYLKIGFEEQDYFLFHVSHYIFFMVCLLQNCDQWFKTWLAVSCLIIITIVDYQMKLAFSYKRILYLSIVASILMIAIFMAGTEYEQKTTFLEKFKSRERKKEYQNLIDNFPEGIIIVPSKQKEAEPFRVSYINQNLKSFLGIVDVEKEDEIQKGLDLQLFLPYNRSLGPGDPAVGLKTIIHQLEGSKSKYYEAIIEDKELGMQKSLLEIQKKKILFQTEDQNLIIMRNVSHIIKQEKIKNRSVYLELLAGTVSHEMMTPLNSIINLAAVTVETINEKNSTSFVDPEHIKIIHRSSVTLHYLIKDLLDLLKIQRGTFQPQVDSQVNPIKVCAETFDLLQNQAQQKGLELCVERATFSEQGKFTFDKDRFKQILLNVLANSVKFAQKGRILVEFKTFRKSESARNLTFSSFITECKDCGTLQTKVTDEGPGIAEERLKTIFHLFAQAEQEGGGVLTTEGIGLGLTVCKQLSELLGGKFSIESKLGEGTRVYFSMDIKCETCHQHLLSGESSSVAGSSRRRRTFVQSPLSQFRINVMKCKAQLKQKERVEAQRKLRKKDSYLQQPFNYEQFIRKKESGLQPEVVEESKHDSEIEGSFRLASPRIEQSARELNHTLVQCLSKQGCRTGAERHHSEENAERKKQRGRGRGQQTNFNQEDNTIDEVMIDETVMGQDLAQKYSFLAPLPCFHKPKHSKQSSSNEQVVFTNSSDSREGLVMENTNARDTLGKEGEECNCQASVLIVDDNALNLIPLELILEMKFSIKVDKAMNGQEAIEVFSRNLYKTCCELKYKLVLMDINMPILDGYAATSKITSILQSYNTSRNEKLTCPVVAVTAYDNDENIKKCFECGMVDVIRKPVSCDALKAVLDNL